MGDFQTFADYLKRRDADRRADDPSPAELGYPGSEPVAETVTRGHPAQSGIPAERDQVAERSIFPGFFKAVNTARPVSPTNSRLLASPIRRRFKSQIIGRARLQPRVAKIANLQPKALVRDLRHGQVRQVAPSLVSEEFQAQFLASSWTRRSCRGVIVAIRVRRGLLPRRVLNLHKVGISDFRPGSARTVAAAGSALSEAVPWDGVGLAGG